MVIVPVETQNMQFRDGAPLQVAGGINEGSSRDNRLHNYSLCISKQHEVMPDLAPCDSFNWLQERFLV